MRQSYPSDISRERFKEIRELLESGRKRTRPRQVDLYDVFCAVLYLLKSGCQWRMLPSDFPKWRTVHHHFSIWSEAVDGNPSLLEQALKKSGWRGPYQTGAQRMHELLDRGRVDPARLVNGRRRRNACTSYLIVDAQSVKNTDSARHKGYDAGKKVSGIKRHIAVDTQGLPHAVAVTTAEVTDRQGALQAFERCAGQLTQVKSVLADGGYTGEPFAQGVRDKLGATVQITKRNELHTFAVIPQRWVVERSFAWLEKCRRLWKNCERSLTPACSSFTWPSWRCF